MSQEPWKDRVSRPALLLIVGRSTGFVVSFAIPVVLARTFDRAEFGAYKQLFLVYATLFGLAQFGAAESLYYFVPRNGGEAGRRVSNAIVMLVLMGAACFVGLAASRTGIARWLTNPGLARDLPLIGAFLALSLVTAVFEIVMVARHEHTKAACTYAASDVTRTVLIVVPALAIGGLRAVLFGAVAFAALRLAAMLVYLIREFRGELLIDSRLCREQFAYALPFALAVAVDVVQANFHQWAVASRFDAATFAVYAVGCLQIPLVDLICTSTANVMMVRLAEVATEGEGSALRLWHDTIARLAWLVLPLAAFFLLAARGVIVLLFTNRYLASVPVFMVWCLMIVPSAFAVDAVLRAYAQPRFLLAMNAVRLAIIAGLIGPFIAAFGLTGAALVTLAATTLVKAVAVVKIARLMNVGLRDVLPWKRLAATAGQATAAVVPAWWALRIPSVSLSITLAMSAAAYATAFGAIGLARVWRRQREIKSCVALPAS